MLNVNPYWHKIVISVVLLAAITFDYARRRRRVESDAHSGEGRPQAGVSVGALRREDPSL